MQTVTTVYFQGRGHDFLNNIALDLVGSVVAYDTCASVSGFTEHEIKKYVKEYVHTQWESRYYATNTIKEEVACRV